MYFEDLQLAQKGHQSLALGGALGGVPGLQEAPRGLGSPLALTEDGNPGLVFRSAGSQGKEMAWGSGGQREESFLQTRPFCEGLRAFWAGRQGPQDVGVERIPTLAPHRCPGGETGCCSRVSSCSCSCRSGSETAALLPFLPPARPSPAPPAELLQLLVEFSLS